MKKILICLNYYYPYISGLSEYARITAEQLAARGYGVTVVASRHEPGLREEEVLNGVRVIRCKVQFRVSKGCISIGYLARAVRLAKSADIIQLHLPMPEAGLLSLFMNRRKMVTMYHCDMNLPEGFLNGIIVGCMDLSHRICLARSARITVTSVDYAAHSRVAGRYAAKLSGIGAPVKEFPPPCAAEQGQPQGSGEAPRSGDAPRSGEAPKNGAGKKRIGFCGRIVEEKGLDVLLRAFMIMKQSREDIELIIAGDYQGVAGGSVYPALRAMIEEEGIEDVTFTGRIKEEKLAAFYAGLDVFALPSVNSLEAFGMVQAEAMMCGVPVVASDLYGVRTIVSRTGMGRVCKRGDADDLARCLLDVLEHRERYVKPPEAIRKRFSTGRMMEELTRVLEEVMAGGGRGVDA